MMRILVTGAAGFVGSRTCDQLELSGNEVIRSVHRPSAGSAFEYVVDVSDTGSLSRLRSIGEVDAVVNCAGIAHRFGKTSDLEFRRVNVDGARNVAELAVQLGAKQLVHLSSVMVYGRGSGVRPIDEGHVPSPTDSYSMSKLEGERAVEAVLSGGSIGVTILRPAPIVGEGSRGNVSRLIRAIDAGRFRWIGNGKNLRSFVYVGDVARAAEFALTLGERRTAFNVVWGEVHVSGLVDIISTRLGKKVGGLRVPAAVAHLGLAATKPLDRIPSVNRYRRTLETWMADAVYSGASLGAHGFRAITSIEEGVQLEVDRYMKNQ